MPVMPRMSSKATKIAHAVLGKPQNENKKTKRDKKIDQQLVFQSLTRVK